jgi:trk system potassium uptake protein TrkH
LLNSTIHYELICNITLKQTLVNSLVKSLLKPTSIIRVAFVLSVLSMFVLAIDFGFNQSIFDQKIINIFYVVVMLMGIISTTIRYFRPGFKMRAKILTFDSISVVITLIILYHHFFALDGFQNLVFQDYWIEIALILTFVRELAELRINYKRAIINPAQLFIFSFLIIILIGAFLLMLPNATHDDLSFLDAFFTSTSAVCVTGLIVVDTATYFTEFGQIIILILIQIGGLGILTFASYFSYFFKGGSSYENQLFISDMTNSQKIGEVFSTLKRILLLTFTIEIIGAIFIYINLDQKLFTSFIERVGFSIFHSISAFCNAGFSTLSNGLYETGYQFNYSLQLVIILLFILGGLGFPIMVNIMKYIKHLFIRILNLSTNKANYKPWVLNLNSRITLITTGLLIVVGTFLFYFSEYNNSLAEHHGFGKFVTALFGATTPRTAGFNTIDMGTLSISTLLIIIFLMWVGASPASTGGGIKTSTLAIATMNFISLAKGKNRIEVYRREIAIISIQRAFAIIFLSLIVIGMGIFFIALLDPDKKLIDIVFECFSAYSTVGLSIGITADLSEGSKMILILMMLIGRVSTLSILIAFVKKEKHKNYRYPTEEITIN